MKIFRWVLSNILLLVVVWTLVYVYLNWDEVKDDMPESVTNLVARFQHEYEKMADAKTDESSVAEHDQQQDPLQQPIPVAETETVTEVIAVEEPVVVETAAQPSEDGSAESDTTDTVVLPESVVAVEEEQVVAIAAPTPVPQGVVAARPVQKHELEQAVRNELIQAREAFWHRDLGKAEKLYADLTVKQSDNPDIWGELGNVYLAQNKVKEAADAYYKAAEILIEEGRLRQVGQLMGVIQMAEPAKAQALDKKIRELYQQTGAVR